MKVLTHPQTVGDLLEEWKIQYGTQDNDTDRLLSIREACDFLGFHFNTLYRLVTEDKNLKVYDLRMPGTCKPCYRIRKSDLEDWLAGRQL